MPFRSKADLITIRMLRDVVITEGIEIINAQSSKDRYLTIFSKWLYGLDVKIIHTRRQRPKSMGGWLQNTFYVRGTDKIVVVSEELKNIFVQKGYPAHHLEVIYNGTPASQYDQVSESTLQQLRQKYGIEPQDTVVGCVARMKEQSQLIEALTRLDDQIKVLFVGIPPGSLEEDIVRHQVKNPIIYTGTVEKSEVLHLYKLMDVHGLPSTMDGFGLVLVEAMALGVPVVATNSGVSKVWLATVWMGYCLRITISKR